MGKRYTCQEVADRYGVRRLTIWQWIRDKKLIAVDTGKNYIITEEDLDAFEQKRKTLQK